MLWSSCVAEPDGGEGFVVRGAAFVGDGDLAVGDVAAVRGAEGVVREGEETGAGEAVEERVEVLAVFRQREVGEELAGGGAAHRDGGEDGAQVVALAGSGLVHRRACRRGRLADVALAAGTERIAAVAEVFDERGHAAGGAFGEGHHGVDLAAARGDLGVVAVLPGGLVVDADVAVEVGDCGAVRDELLDRSVEGFLIELELALKVVG